VGLAPDVAHQVGDRKRNRAGLELGGVYAETYLVYRMPARSQHQIGELIEEGVAWVECKSERMRTFRATGGTVELYLTVEVAEHCGVELRSEVLSKVSDLGVRISLEMIPLLSD